MNHIVIDCTTGQASTLPLQGQDAEAHTRSQAEARAAEDERSKTIAAAAAQRHQDLQLLKTALPAEAHDALTRLLGFSD